MNFFKLIWIAVKYLLWVPASVIFAILYFILCPYWDEQDIIIQMDADYLNHFDMFL